MLFGPDCSNWSGVPTRAQVNALGADFAIPGTQNVAIAGLQISAFEFANVPTELYTFPQHIQHVRELTPARKMVWLDAEEGSYDSLIGNIDGTRNAITNDVASLQEMGYEVGIYTRESWWRDRTGDWNGMATLKLWSANPDRFPSGFGGWLRPHTVQYKGTTSVNGFSVDLNVRDSNPQEVIAIDGMGIHFNDGSDYRGTAEELKGKLIQ